MRDILFTPQAKNDLIELSEYIARHNLKAAQQTVHLIEHSILRLSLIPGIGHR
ncbi:type II toxin-antitoxin system RelE/ParE family toxin [bacterium]|nr:type II toxin-antitoxin system RelE/ParE family toxin [bacterium]